MPTLGCLPEVRPISDLRTHLKEIEDTACETGEPIVLTRNGKSRLVVQGADAYNEQRLRERAVLKLREAEIEARYAAETFTHEEVVSRMNDILESAKAAHA